MTDEEQYWCHVLRQSCQLTSDQDESNFLQAIQALSKATSSDVLRNLLKSFRTVEADAVQYELVDACEGFPRDVYIQIFLQEAPEFMVSSPKWFNLMLSSILNTDDYRMVFIDIFKKDSTSNKHLIIHAVKNLVVHNEKYLDVLLCLERSLC